MTIVYDTSLDREIARITSQLSDVNFNHQKADESLHRSSSSANKENEDGNSLISKSFMLDELLESNEKENSKLEIYKDILNEKMHTKTKIPTPLVSNQKIGISERHSPKLMHSGSRLPISLSSMKLAQKQAQKKDSISSLRSVSDSPSRPALKTKVFDAENGQDSYYQQSPSLQRLKARDPEERRRKVQSMIAPSKRLVSAPMHQQNSKYARHTEETPSTPSKTRLPSYLKQTASSLNKATPNSKDPGAYVQSAVPSSVRTKLSMERAEKRKSYSGTLRRPSMKPPTTGLTLNSLSETPVLSSQPQTDHTVQTLSIPKLRANPAVSKIHKTSNPSVALSGVTRSLTQSNLNASLASANSNTEGLPPKIRKTSASLTKRKSSNPSAQNGRVSSITSSKKIVTVAELYKIVSKSSLVKTWERAQNHRFVQVEPIHPTDLHKHSRYKLLNNYERGEIVRKTEIYYVGEKSKPEVNVADFDKNFGFDDKQNNYIIEKGDHINYRFRVLSTLGNGAFGSVVACNDYKQDRICAVKIVKNEMTCSLQAVSEVKILKLLSQASPDDNHVIKYYGHFHFRGHMCITSEYLPINLYQVLEISNFRGLDLSVVAHIATQVLKALKFLHTQIGVIHCDLKPENLMLASPYSFDVKLIDFGSAVAINEISFSYLQSRFYRAPEVTLGARYNEKIDIWSFATILVELYVGLPLFPCENENELMGMYLDLIGEPDAKLIRDLRDDIWNNGCVGGSMNDKSLLWQVFSGKGGFLEKNLQRLTNKPFNVGSKSIQSAIEAKNFNENQESSRRLESFIDMMSKCLVWDYRARSGAGELEDHEFLSTLIV